MTTFSVNVKVNEIVDGFENVVEELKRRYLGYAVLGMLAILLAFVTASFLGAMCGILCYNNFCRRRRRRRPKMTAV